MRTMEHRLDLDRTQSGHQSRTEGATLALGGYALCVSGFFVLAAAGSSYPTATYALIFGGALLAGLPILLLTVIVATTETATGRAWASGFRRLLLIERTKAATFSRALRYAGIVWIANGLALWVASIPGIL